MIRTFVAALAVLIFAASAADAKPRRHVSKATPAEITAAFYADPSGTWLLLGYPAWAVFAFKADGNGSSGAE